MFEFEKKIYAFIEKRLIYVILLVSFAVGCFIRMRGLYDNTIDLGGRLWEQSAAYTHSGLYSVYVRGVWIYVFKAQTNLYRYSFIVWDCLMAILAGIALSMQLQKEQDTEAKTFGALLTCLLMLSPLTFETGAVMLHLDSLCISLLLLVKIIEDRKGKANMIPEIVVFSICSCLEPIFILVILAYVIIRKSKPWALLAIPFGILINGIVECMLGTPVVTGFYNSVRFWFVSESSGALFRNPGVALVFYLVNLLGYVGVYFLYKAFANRKFIYGALHLIMILVLAQFIFHGFII